MKSRAENNDIFSQLYKACTKCIESWTDFSYDEQNLIF